MGFAAGEHGVKRAVVQKENDAAIYRAPTLYDALQEIPGAVTNRTVAIRDTTQLFVGAPSHLGGLDEWVDFATQTLIHDLSTACIVWWCLDDPEKTPFEKAATQSARQKKQAVVPGIPLDDNYNTDDLRNVSSCKPLVLNRPSRYRCIDEILRRVLERVRSYSHHSVVILDGVDPLGADRHIGQPRSPIILCEDEALAEMIGDVTTDALTRDGVVPRVATDTLKLGEADVRIRVADDCVRLLQRRKIVLGGVDCADLNLVLVHSIDTDQIAIAMLAEAERDEAHKGLDCTQKSSNVVVITDSSGDISSSSTHDITHPVQTLLCYKERGQWAAAELQTYRTRYALAMEKDLAESGILLIDPRGLFKLHVDRARRFATPDGYRGRVNFQSELSYIRLLIACWTLTGCDYVPPVSQHNRLITSLMTTATNIRSLDTFDWCHMGLDRVCALNRWHRAKRLLMEVLADTRQKGSKRQKCDSSNLEVAAEAALWTTAYWSILPPIV